MTRTDYILEHGIPADVEAFAIALIELGSTARRDGVRSVQVTAQDAGEALLALLDVIEHRRRTVEVRTL